MRRLACLHSDIQKGERDEWEKGRKIQRAVGCYRGYGRPQERVTGLSWHMKVSVKNHCNPYSQPATNMLLVFCLEWCKTRARAHRWQEECLLLEEEMRRTLTFFQWKSNELTEMSTLPAVAQNEGLRAYGLRQASIWQHLHSSAVDSLKDCATALSTGERATKGDLCMVEYEATGAQAP